MTKQTHESRELGLFIENDGVLYRNQILPIIHNLARKQAKGMYDSAKALKLWGYLATNGAKAYGIQHGTGAASGLSMFSTKDRALTAEYLSESYSEHREELATQYAQEIHNKKAWPLSVIRANTTGHFFDRDTMRFFGDTMANFGVRYEGNAIIVYRKKTGRKGGNILARWQFIPETGAMEIIPDSV